MEEVGQLLQPGQRILLLVMGKDGVVCERTVVPRPFDPKKPQSLLGCQITDTCPNRFLPHPALRVMQQSKGGSNGGGDACAESGMSASNPSSAAEQAEQGLRPVPDAPYDARAVLRQQSYAWHDDAGGTSESDDFDEEMAELEYFHGDEGSDEDSLVGSDHVHSAKEQSSCNAAPQTNGAVKAAGSDVATAAKSWRETLRGFRWRSRLVLLIASLLNFGHGCAFLAAPSFGSEATAILRAFHQNFYKVVTSTCAAAGDAHLRALAAEIATNASIAVASGKGSGAAASQLTFGGFVRTALLASCLELVLALAGIALALLPHDGILPRTRLGLIVFYPPAALVLWLLLAAGTVYCLTFRWEADDLLRNYWRCLDENSPLAGASMSSRYFDSVKVAAAVSASANLSVILGLFAACALTGWREVLRTSVLAFGVLSAVGGGMLASLGAVLVHSGNVLPPPATFALLALGLATLAFGLLGIAAAKSERISLLRLHAAVLGASSLAVSALCAVLLVRGVDGLQPLLHQLVNRFNANRPHPNAQDVSSIGLLVLASSEPPNNVVVDDADVDDMIDLLQAHRLSVSAASVLGLFLMVMNVTMALGLQWLVRSQRHDVGGGRGHYEAITGGAGGASGGALPVARPLPSMPFGGRISDV